MKEMIKTILIVCLITVAFTLTLKIGFDYTTTFLEDWFFATIISLIIYNMKDKKNEILHS